jgi:hypothetical protein
MNYFPFDHGQSGPNEEGVVQFRCQFYDPQTGSPTPPTFIFVDSVEGIVHLNISYQ